jgi:hypothetical protein
MTERRTGLLTRRGWQNFLAAGIKRDATFPGQKSQFASPVKEIEKASFTLMVPLLPSQLTLLPPAISIPFLPSWGC